MKIRILSALGIILTISSLFYFLGPNGLKAFICIAFFIASFELRLLLFGTSVERSRDEKRVSFVLRTENLFILILWTLFGVNVYNKQTEALSLMNAFVAFTSGVIFLHRRNPNIKQLMSEVKKGLVGFLYLGLLPIPTIQLLDLQNGSYLIISLLFIVYLNDTFALFFGRTFGKDFVLPYISPKKTLQGSLGGILGSIAGAAIFIEILPDSIDLGSLAWLKMILLAIITGYASQMGDFWESLMKRVAGVKDSGTILPGHGGILDRVDSILFACPIFLQGYKLLFF